MNNLRTILIIQQTVEDYFGLPRWETDKKTRKREIVEARFIIFYLANKLTEKCTDYAIGTIIGGKDHATVIHAVSQAETLSSVDKEFKDNLILIENIVKDKLHDINHVLS